MGNKDTAPAAELQALAPLVGNWNTDMPEVGDTSKRVHGRVTFEWMEGGKFLIERSRIEHELYPDSIAVIGYDEENERYVQHYFDSRGVKRTYYMSIENGVWMLWRDDDPNFLQRFSGTFSDDGNTIDGQWDANHDDKGWKPDFALTYTKEA